MARCYRKDIQLFHMQAFDDVAIEPSSDHEVTESSEMKLTSKRPRNAMKGEFADVEVEEEGIPPKRKRCSSPGVCVAPASSTTVRVPDVTSSFRFDWGPARSSRFLRISDMR